MARFFPFIFFILRITTSDEICSYPNQRYLKVYLRAGKTKDSCDDGLNRDPDPYVTATINGISKISDTEDSTDKPTWNEWMDFGCVEVSDTLYFEVEDEDYAETGSDDKCFGGSTTTWLSDYDSVCPIGSDDLCKVTKGSGNNQKFVSYQLYVWPPILPSLYPTRHPTANPSSEPSSRPTRKPTPKPTKNPNHEPTVLPIPLPSTMPTIVPIPRPTLTLPPSAIPTYLSTPLPSPFPTESNIYFSAPNRSSVSYECDAVIPIQWNTRGVAAQTACAIVHIHFISSDSRKPSSTTIQSTFPNSLESTYMWYRSDESLCGETGFIKVTCTAKYQAVSPTFTIEAVLSPSLLPTQSSLPTWILSPADDIATISIKTTLYTASAENVSLAFKPALGEVLSMKESTMVNLSMVTGLGNLTQWSGMTPRQLSLDLVDKTDLSRRLARPQASTEIVEITLQIRASVSRMGYESASAMTSAIDATLETAVRDGSWSEYLKAECGCYVFVMSVLVSSEYFTLPPSPPPSSPPPSSPPPSPPPTALPTYISHNSGGSADLTFGSASLIGVVVLGLLVVVSTAFFMGRYFAKKSDRGGHHDVVMAEMVEIDSSLEAQVSHRWNENEPAMEAQVSQVDLEIEFVDQMQKIKTPAIEVPAAAAAVPEVSAAAAIPEVSAARTRRRTVQDDVKDKYRESMPYTRV